MPLVNIMVNSRAYTGSIGQASEAVAQRQRRATSGRATQKNWDATCRW
jgi:hypothetical protein